MGAARKDNSVAPKQTQDITDNFRSKSYWNATCGIDSNRLNDPLNKLPGIRLVSSVL